MYIINKFFKKKLNKSVSIKKQFSNQCNIKMYEYESASNPNMSKIPIKILKNNNSNLINYFDLSTYLKTRYRATSPNLLASFLNIYKNSGFTFKSNGSSNMFYIISGKGKLENSDINYEVNDGDIVTFPYYVNGLRIKSYSNEDLILYHVDDSPLMKYLGVIPDKIIIPPTIYKKDEILSFMNKINGEDGAKNRNRNGVLLGNNITEELGTKTLTNILWSLYNIIGPNTVQKPHKHNSVALDLCTYAVPNKVYTLIGKDIDENGNIINPEKVYWETNCAFTTPPGYWHSHVNESNENAYVLPVQDAGLYTYQRTLDINFVR